MFIFACQYHARKSLAICRLLVLIPFVLFNFTDHAGCQESFYNKQFQYIYPPENAKYVTRESSIILRYGKKILKESISDSIIKVTGSSNGKYSGKLHLCKDEKTLVFEHSEPFDISEKINVKLLDGIYTTDKKRIPGLDFSFSVSGNKSIKSSLKTTNNDFPEIYSLINNNPSNGYHFLEKNDAGYSYLMIIDNYGTPVFYRKLEHNTHNFSLQPSGYLSYYIENQKCYAILDSLYNFTGIYSMKNGYDADSHEFILQKNGHSFMIAYDRQLVRMDTVIDGGNPDATVVGLVIQELDEEQNVIFQWRSWDHFSILDTDDSVVDLTSQYVDYVHGNSLDIDSDTSLLLCSRNLNEVTKIHRQTGKIIWRLGGKNNQFTFINDDRGFALQHSAKKLENSKLILFDNGKIGVADYSRGVEYELDETYYTAHLVNEFKHDSSIFSIVSGHIQRLSNGNTIIGWGKNIGKYVSTEFTPDGTIANDLYTDYNVQSYRVYKFDWKSKAIELNKDIMSFRTIQPYQTDTAEIQITNNISDDLVLNGYTKGNAPFSVITHFPIIIPENSTGILQIKFVPNSTGEYNDIFTIYSDCLSENNEPQRIAAQFAITGTSSTDISSKKDVLSDRNSKFQVYPNPVSDYLTITGTVDLHSIGAINILGELMILDKTKKSNTTRIDCSDLPPGIYMLILTDNNGLRHSIKFVRKEILY